LVHKETRGRRECLDQKEAQVLKEDKARQGQVESPEKREK